MTQRDPTPAELIAFVRAERDDAIEGEYDSRIEMFSALLTVLEGRRQDDPAPLPDAAPSPTCYWSQDDCGGDSTWETSCKRDFYFDGTDGPIDAGFTHCPFCGKPLVEQRTSDDALPPLASPPAKEPRDC